MVIVPTSIREQVGRNNSNSAFIRVLLCISTIQTIFLYFNTTGQYYYHISPILSFGENRGTFIMYFLKTLLTH